MSIFPTPSSTIALSHIKINSVNPIVMVILLLLAQFSRFAMKDSHQAFSTVKTLGYPPMTLSLFQHVINLFYSGTFIVSRISFITSI